MKFQLLMKIIIKKLFNERIEKENWILFFSYN